MQVAPSGLGFPPGEHPVVIYLVDAAQEWREVGRNTLRVLTGSDFEKAAASPTLEVGLNGQATIGRTPEQPPTDRATFQDLSVRLGLATEHVRSGWTTTSDVRIVGVNERQQALRFGTLGEQAPFVDLGSYQVALRNQHVTLARCAAAPRCHRHELTDAQVGEAIALAETRGYGWFVSSSNGNSGCVRRDGSFGTWLRVGAKAPGPVALSSVDPALGACGASCSTNRLRPAGDLRASR